MSDEQPREYTEKRFTANDEQPREYTEKRFTANEMFGAFLHGTHYQMLRSDKDLGTDTPTQNLPFWDWLNRRHPKWQHDHDWVEVESMRTVGCRTYRCAACWNGE